MSATRPSAFRPAAGPYLMLSAPLPDRAPAMVMRSMPPDAAARLSAEFGAGWCHGAAEGAAEWQAAVDRELAAGALVYVYRRADLAAP